MDEILKGALRSSWFFCAACLLVWAVAPGLRTIAAGCILGTLASAFNAVLLRKRIEAMDKALTNESKKPVGSGMGARTAMVLIVAMIAYKFPEHFHIMSAIFASFFAQIALFVVVVVLHIKGLRRKG